MTQPALRTAFVVTLCAASLLLSGCAHRGDTTRGVVVTMTRLTVAPTPENNPSVQWDEGRHDSRGDDGCGLLMALDFVAAGLGSVASAVCTAAASGGEAGQWKAEDPDLFVEFEAGSGSYRSPVIADRASHDRAYSLFIPRDALRDTGLELTVYDLDGAGAGETTLIADHQLARSELGRRIELRGEELDEPSLKLLRLEVADAPRPQSEQLTMRANDGLVEVPGLAIPAGMLVEIRATGSYRIGSWNDAKLGPEGYPGGGPKDYNLPGKAFRAAKHGAAVALLQNDSAAQAVVVGECARFVSTAGGSLYVGVNDRDYRNNRGELSFEVRVTTPDPGTWARGGVEACGAESPANTSNSS